MPEVTVRMVGEAFETMIAASDSVHRSANHLERASRIFAKIFIPIVVTMLLIVAGLIVVVRIQNTRAQAASERIDKLEGIVESLQRSSNETKTAAVSAEIAAESADSTLKEALAQSQRGGVNPEVVEALNKVNEMYEVCVQRKEC